MDKIIKVRETDYMIVNDIREGFDAEKFKEKCTDYFDDYDYVVGDWAYGKLRLKGFYDETNKKAKDLNNIKYLDDYIKKYCAFDCRYFVAKKYVQKM